MKQFVLLVIFVAIGTTLSGCDSTGSTQSAVSADEAEKITEVITKLSNEWGRVRITKDIDHLRRIWADDFSYTNPDGTVANREDGFANFDDSTYTYTSARLTAFNVRVYGNNFAVAAGADHLEGKDKDGKPLSRHTRFTNVWVRKATGWQVVAGHNSLLSEDR